MWEGRAEGARCTQLVHKASGSSGGLLVSLMFWVASESDLNAPLPCNRRGETSCMGQKLVQKFRCVSACTV